MMNKGEINCVYSTNGITTMSTKQYDNYIKIINNLKKEKEHYKHLYSEVKKQKDDVVEFIKEYHNYENRFKWCEQNYIDTINEIERMLGEIDEI